MNYQKRKEGSEKWSDAAIGEVPEHMKPGYEYRIKPEPAAPKWPQTTMTREYLHDLHQNDPTLMDLRRFANSVIEHECSTGTLVPADKVREIEAKALLFGREEGEKRSENRDREVMWFALQRGPTCPTSEELDNLVRMVKK